MAVSHIKSDTIADFTGTFTGFNSQGSTTTIAATNVVRPSDWNSVHNQFYTLTGNTTQNTTASGTNVVFAGSGGVSVGGTSDTVVISASPEATISFWMPELYGATLTSAHANGTLYIRPYEAGNYMDIDYAQLWQSFSSTRTTASFSASVSAGNASSGTGSWGMTGTQLFFSRKNTNETNADFYNLVTFASDSYSMSAGYSASVSWSTNVSSATASVTTSVGVGFIKNIDGAGGVTTTATTNSGTTSFSSTSTNANSFSSTFLMSFPYAHFSGVRPIFIPCDGTNQPPGEYWYGNIQSTTTGSTNMVLQSVAFMSGGGVIYRTDTTNNYMEIGNSVAITSSNWRPGFGSYSASSRTTTTIGLSEISAMASNASMFFLLAGQTR